MSECGDGRGSRSEKLVRAASFGHVARLTGPGWQATPAEPFKPGQNMRGGGGLAHRRVGEVELINAPALGSLTSSFHRQRTGSGTPTGFWLRSRS
jgi:hypothetical protein